jgi:hypothetical protein
LPSERVWREEPFRLPLGGPECGQRIVRTAARKLELRPNVVQPQPRGRLGFLSYGAFGALDPWLCLLEPPAPDECCTQRQVGLTDEGVVGPAVLPGQFDRLRAGLHD